jgi:hypothetical protein
MPLSHRTERIAEQLREEVSQILATEVADPGVGLVTVTRVKVTPDLSLARVYWTLLGDDAERKRTKGPSGRVRATCWLRALRRGACPRCFPAMKACRPSASRSSARDPRSRRRLRAGHRAFRPPNRRCWLPPAAPEPHDPDTTA